MNLKTILLLFLTLIFINCNNKESNNEVQIVDHNTGFQMELPKGFQKMDNGEADKVLKVGKDNIDKIYETNIDISDVEPTLFKKDKDHYFLFNIRNYDAQIDGDYNELTLEANKLLLSVYQQSFPNSKIDTSTSKEKIDKMVFEKYSLQIDFPESKRMNVITYSKLINKKDFTLAVIYSNDEVGQQVLNSIKQSKFSRIENRKQ